MPAPYDGLDSLFARARAEKLPLGGSVSPEVWRRLEAARRAPVRLGWLGALEAAMARPSFVVTFVAACVLGGLFLAEFRLSRLHAERNAQLARSYLRLIDPLLENAPPAAADAAPLHR